MTHLFKLKKDGETVGYCKLIKYRDSLDFSKNWMGWGFSKNGNNWGQQRISFDIAHPFVCTDKNDKDVFADDEVDSIGNRCRVMWHKVHLQWCLWHIKGDYYFGTVAKQDIELLEEKE